MPLFTVDSHRADPYVNFKFILSWDGRPVAGVSSISPLKRTTQVVRHRDGADPGTRSLGQTDWEPITLERGVTHDTAFEQWANKVWDVPHSSALGKEVSLPELDESVTAPTEPSFSDPTS